MLEKQLVFPSLIHGGHPIEEQLSTFSPPCSAAPHLIFAPLAPTNDSSQCLQPGNQNAAIAPISFFLKIVPDIRILL